MVDGAHGEATHADSQGVAEVEVAAQLTANVAHSDIPNDDALNAALQVARLGVPQPG